MLHAIVAHKTIRLQRTSERILDAIHKTTMVILSIISSGLTRVYDHWFVLGLSTCHIVS